VQVPIQDVSTVYANNKAAGLVSTGLFNTDPNALVAGGRVNSFTGLFNQNAGDNAAQVHCRIP
jgi:hypothetical protein